MTELNQDYPEFDDTEYGYCESCNQEYPTISDVALKCPICFETMEPLDH